MGTSIADVDLYDAPVWASIAGDSHLPRGRPGRPLPRGRRAYRALLLLLLAWQGSVVVAAWRGSAPSGRYARGRLRLLWWWDHALRHEHRVEREEEEVAVRGAREVRQVARRPRVKLAEEGVVRAAVDTCHAVAPGARRAWCDGGVWHNAAAQ